MFMSINNQGLQHCFQATFDIYQNLEILHFSEWSKGLATSYRSINNRDWSVAAALREGSPRNRRRRRRRFDVVRVLVRHATRNATLA